MRSYYRVMLGASSAYADEALQGSYIGAGFGIEQDLTADLFEDWREFNKKFIPIYLASYPDKTKVGAGLACGFLWTVSKGIAIGDYAVSPDGRGHYHIGEVTGPYFYVPGSPLPHRRPVKWLNAVISRQDMSIELKRSTGSIGTVANISGYADELEKLIGEKPKPPIVATDPNVEDPALFAMEKHLEDFLVDNWNITDLGKGYDIYTENDEVAGQQFPTDTGPIDILAVSRDKKTLLVIELKKGRASDVVVGQTLRYMGYVSEVLAEPGQQVRGAIIALEHDQRLRRALAMVDSVSFYRYEVSFKLVRT